LECGIRGQEPGRGRPPATTQQSHESVPQYDPRRLTAPGGALDTNARFYIERPADQEVLSGIRKDRALVTLLGARQSGKTSLIARVHVAALGGRLPLRSAFVDVQAIPPEPLQSLETAWRYLAEGIAARLELRLDWAGQGNHERGFQQFLKNTVFTQDDTPLLICLDEVDRLFSNGLRKESFASLRACWNKGASGPVTAEHLFRPGLFHRRCYPVALQHR